MKARSRPNIALTKLIHHLNERRVSSRLAMRRAFTLIELLVVIAIIAILAAILFPVFAQAKAAAKKTACLSNNKQIGIGMMLYTNDNDDTYPGNDQWEPSPLNSNPSDPRMPYDLMIMPYVKNEQIFVCPDDTTRATPASANNFWDVKYRDKALRRTYQFVGNIVTVEAGAALVDKNTGLSTYPYPSTSSPIGHNGSEVNEPANTIGLVEVWGPSMKGSDASYLGSASAAAFVLCDTWKLPGRPFPAKNPGDLLPSVCTSGYHLETQQPTPGHGNGGNYAFADGHAKFQTWGAIRNNDFAVFKLQKSATVFNP